MTPAVRFRRSGAAVLSAAVARRRAPGRRPAGCRPPAPREGVRAAVDVTAMDLDVVATGKNGRARAGSHEGRGHGRRGRQAVRARLLRAHRRPARSTGRTSRPRRPTSSSRRRALGETRWVPRQFLAFFDDEHLMPFERKRVIEGLRDLVTRLSPSDSMALLAYNISTRVFVPFTNSKEDLPRGLSKLEKTAPRGLYWDTQYRQAIAGRPALLPVSTRGQSSRDSIVRNWGAQALAPRQGHARGIPPRRRRARRRARASASSSTSRTGMELRPGPEPRPVARRHGPEPVRLRPDARSTGPSSRPRTARGSRSTRSTPSGSSADGRRLRVRPAGDRPLPREREPARDPRGLRGRDGRRPRREPQHLRPVPRRASTASPRATTRSASPSRPSTRRRPLHDVRLTTTRPGVTLRTRRGFAPLTAAQAARDRLEMALITPDAAATSRSRSGRTRRRREAAWGGASSRSRSSSPSRRSRSSTTRGQKKAVVEIGLAAVEDTGARSTPVTEKQEIVVTPEALAAVGTEPFVYRGEFKSRTGNMRFVATVRDVATNRVGVASASVRVE